MQSHTSPVRWPLHTQILLGLGLGAASGIGVNEWRGGSDPTLQWVVTQITEPLGQVFLRLLLMTVVPLVFSSLVLGVAGIGNIRTLGRVGLKSIVYCLMISVLSVVLGISLVNLIRPGKRIPAATAASLQERYAADASAEVGKSTPRGPKDPPLLAIVKTLVPVNPISAVASETPNLLHLMFFALALGVVATAVPREKCEPFLSALEGLNALCAQLIGWVMRLAPLAVACLVFSNLARFGFDLLFALGSYVVTVLLGLGIHMFGVYAISVRWLSGIRPLEFFARIRTIIYTAFSTSSSVATLPTTLRVSEENLGIPREINSFVLTVGATANQNGTALYEGVTVLFLAQLAGLNLTLGQQIGVAGMAILGSIGTAGLPSASIPFVIVVLASIGVNPALIGIIIGVDRLLDMCRTVVNVVGDVTAAAFVARSEGHLLCAGNPTNFKKEGVS